MQRHADLRDLIKGKYFDDTTCHREGQPALHHRRRPLRAAVRRPQQHRPGAVVELARREARLPQDRRPAAGGSQTATYPAGTIAVANANRDANPMSGTEAVANTGSSQFFLVYKDTVLPANYAVIGKVDDAGIKVLEQIAAKGVPARVPSRRSRTCPPRTASPRRPSPSRRRTGVQLPGLADPVSIGGYAVVRRLGAGGMGEVYLVQHPRLPGRTALKLLSGSIGTDEEAKARFLREADVLATLSHPNIVHLYDRGDGRLWLTMEYVEGSDAAQLLRERRAHRAPARTARDAPPTSRSRVILRCRLRLAAQ